MINHETDSFSAGQLIFYTNKHIALVIKPENGEDIWQVGLFLKYVNDLKRDCIILDKDGKELKCPTFMIQKLQ